MKLFSFRNLRVFLLLLLLAYVAIYTKSQRVESMAWLDPLEVVVFPINADHDAATAEFIGRLQTADFETIDEFTAKQAGRYQVLAKPPTRTILGPEVMTLPPSHPEQGASTISKALWSLQLRFWAWKNTPDGYGGQNTVHIFVLYQQPVNGQRLDHSLGLQKGLLGIVHAYATPAQMAQNKIVITHEMLHTVGASDKYDAAGLPVFPQGYAAPERSPLYPQKRCEIMAGRIAKSQGNAVMADKLRNCLIGPMTAREINWIDE